MLAHISIAIVLIPEPIKPAINASKKNLDNMFGINDLKKLTMKGRIKYPAIPPTNPKDQNIRIVKSLLINHHFLILMESINGFYIKLMY